jgi:hypothetical protein
MLPRGYLDGAAILEVHLSNYLPIFRKSLSQNKHIEKYIVL